MLMQARPSAIPSGKCGGRDASLLPCAPCFSHSCLSPPSLPPSDSPPPHRSKWGNALLGLPTLSPPLTSPIFHEQDRSANVQAACAGQTIENNSGWKDLSSTVLPTPYRHAIPRCNSARQLMRAIKGCSKWPQLFDLTQAHSPQNLNPALLTSSDPQGSSAVHDDQMQHEAAPLQTHSITPQAELTHSPSTTSNKTQQPWQASDLEAPTINHIHLAAILTHLAQLRTDPSTDSALQAWCMELLQQVVQPHMLQALSIRQLANIMWACARLGMHGETQPQHTHFQKQHSLHSLRGAGSVGLGSLSSSSGLRAWGGGRYTGQQARCWKALLGAHGQRMREASLLLGAGQQQRQQQQQPPKLQQQHQDLQTPNVQQQQQQEQVLHPPKSQQRVGLQTPDVRQQQRQQQQRQHPLCVHDVVHVLYACALAGQDPGAEWLKLSLRCSRPLLQHMTPAEAASWAYALCALGLHPVPEWAIAYVRASAGLLGAMTPHELALTVRGVPCIMHACSSVAEEDWVESSSSNNSSSSKTSSSSSATGGGTQKHWQQACFAALLHALPGLDTLHACAVLWGLSLLGWRPQPPLMDALLHVAVYGQQHGAAEDTIPGRRELAEGAAGVRQTEGSRALPAGRDGLNAAQKLQGGIARQQDGLDVLHGSSGGSAAAAARSKGGKSEDGADDLGPPVALELSSWSVANVLTATARLGVKPSGAWVGQLLDALISSSRVQSGLGQSAASHSNSSSKPGVFAPGHDATSLVPSQQQQQQQQKPRHSRTTASRLLADVNASMLACVLLRYQPPLHVMHQLVGLAHEGLPWASPAEVADMLWAFAKLRYVPHRAWLAACFSATGRVLHHQALQQQHMRKQLLQQQELQQLQEGGGIHTLAPPHSAPLSPQQADPHQEEQGVLGQPQDKVNQHLQQQQNLLADGFDSHTLCKLMWALASLSQMQRASLSQMQRGGMPQVQQLVVPQASSLGSPQQQMAPSPPTQHVDTPASHPAKSGDADQQGLPSHLHLPQQQRQQSLPDLSAQQSTPRGSQTQLLQHGSSQQSSDNSGSPPCSMSSDPPPHQRTRSRRRHASQAQPPSPSLSSSPSPSQVPVSPQGALPTQTSPSPSIPTTSPQQHHLHQPLTTLVTTPGALVPVNGGALLPQAPSTPTTSPEDHAGPGLHKPVIVHGAPVPVYGGALPPRPPPVPQAPQTPQKPPQAPPVPPSVPAAPTRSLDSKVHTHAPSQPAGAPEPSSLHSQTSPAAALPHVPMQQPTFIPPAWLEASLAVLHTHIPRMEPQHLPEILWAFATLDIVPPSVSRRRLAAAVAQHVGQLSPKYVAAVVGGLPRVCVTRVHDSCGMLAAVLAAGRATLGAMQPKELTYYLRGLHGMGYVLSKKALLQLAADLASYPHLQKLAAKDLVAVIDALAGLDMGLLPVTAELPSKNSSSSSSSSSGSDSNSSRNSSTSSKTKERSRKSNSVRSSEGNRAASLASSCSGTSTPLLQLQNMLLGRLQPQLKYLPLLQIASLVTALSILGWRPPSSFWPCLYASIALKPAPPSGRIPAAVLLALAKYGAVAAAVEEADAAAAALRAESSAVKLMGPSMEALSASKGSSSTSTGSASLSTAVVEAVKAAAPAVGRFPALQVPSTCDAAGAAAAASSAGHSSNITGPGAQSQKQAEGSSHGFKATSSGSDGVAAGPTAGIKAGGGGSLIAASNDGNNRANAGPAAGCKAPVGVGGSVDAASNGGSKTDSSGSDGIAAHGADGAPLRSEPRHDQFLLPPGVLVQRLLDFVTGDLAALRPSEVAELVLALVRLRHDPGGSWMRALLDHLETRSAACNREDHQLLQRAWRRLSRARKAGLVRTPRKQHYLQAIEGGGERGPSKNSSSSSSSSSSGSSTLRRHASPQKQQHRLLQHKKQEQ